jgi:hypothetical protein
MGDGIDDFAFSAVDLYGYGVVYIYSGPGSSTGVDIDFDPELPGDYRLSHNYPNPFNPSTTIAFALPRRGFTKLTVYNILGETVQTLVNKELAPGSYKVTWDGKGSSGQDVASGVYFYTLSSGQYVQARKMVLLR